MTKAQRNFADLQIKSKVWHALRNGNFDQIDAIATRMGMSKTDVKRGLKLLEGEGKAWFDYNVNGWKLETK